MVISKDSDPNDPFDLQRFLSAQQGIIVGALRELRAGRKTSHWMWFVFPQLAGLGSSGMARRYAIGSLAEAEAYLRHPLLGARLLACTQAVNSVTGRTAHEIFGAPDDIKFRSSMTLFERVPGTEAAFSVALDTFYAGRRDSATLGLLDTETRAPGS
ncbi:MAG: DUF1810 domain-containing protein [Burkholderiaceae bacterium]|nr:DUF1810 domain-containing protein [Sulfuritalea sp.]MCF8175414.1 DUF1810 domain-containing protein [Burkholderiaceae bacterium]MCF8184377.1 DUF1810 domain-containing protein [Polynucleobacter sp.]